MYGLDGTYTASRPEITSVCPSSDVKGKDNVPMPAILTHFPPIPFILSLVAAKFCKLRASFTIMRLAPVSMMYGILSVSTTKQ